MCWKYRCDRCNNLFDEDDFVIETGLCFGCNSIILGEVMSVKENKEK